MAEASTTIRNPGDTIGNDTVAIQRFRKIYLKDVSFEAPCTPGIFAREAEHHHNVKIDVRVAHQTIGNDEYEVSVRMTLAALGQEDETRILIEVEQAGIFGVRDISAGDLHDYLRIHCPRALYPFARQVIWNMLIAGGFPNLLLQDFDFEVMARLSDDQAGAPAD